MEINRKSDKSKKIKNQLSESQNQSDAVVLDEKRQEQPNGTVNFCNFFFMIIPEKYKKVLKNLLCHGTNLLLRCFILHRCTMSAPLSVLSVFLRTEYRDEGRKCLLFHSKLLDENHLFLRVFASILSEKQLKWLMKGVNYPKRLNTAGFCSIQLADPS